VFRFQAQRSAVNAAKYLVSELAYDELTGWSLAEAGRWCGKGAERLGLRGPVTRDQFVRLAINVHPTEERPLSARTASNRPPGVHCTLDGPKSVSVMAMLHDPRLMAAVAGAARSALSEAESRAMARVRRDGENSVRLTGELVAAEFIHHLARPVAGVSDPQVHVHYFIFNETYDSVEEQWKALYWKAIAEDRSVIDAAFQEELKKRVQELGYDITERGNRWELAGVPVTVVEKFSRRTEQIRAFAEAHGITDPRELDEIAARTREAKSGTPSYSALIEEWQSKLNASEADALEAVFRRTGASRGSTTEDKAGPEWEGSRQQDRQQTREQERESKRSATSRADLALLDEALREALGKGFERRAVIPERELIRAGLEATDGRVTLRDIRERLAASSVITKMFNGERCCTTKVALAEERALVELIISGQGRYKRLETSRVGLLTGLSPEQRAAVKTALSSPDLLTMIKGRTGVGKTTLTTAAVYEIQAWIGCPVCMLAPTAQAARGVLREQGHKNADTVAAFLTDKKLQESVRNGIIWVDEAGMLGTKDMKALLEVAAGLKARVIAMGDDKQQRAVARSGWWEASERLGNVRVAVVEGVQRQKGAYKEFAELVNKGDLKAAFEKLDAMGAIREHPRDEVLRVAAADYVAIRSQKHSVVAVLETHRAIDEFTTHTRTKLEDQGKLGKSRTFERLHSRGLTTFEKREASSYRPGDTVEFTRATWSFGNGQFEPGGRWEVMGLDPFGNVMIRKGLDVRALPLSKAECWDVYERKSCQVARGDTLRITKTCKVEALSDKVIAPFVPSRREPNHSITNGSFVDVAVVLPTGSIVLTNGKILPKNFGHFTHGYAVTTFGSQGATRDWAMPVMLSDSGPAARPEQLVVGGTRGVMGVRFYTDNKEAVREVLERGSPLRSAAVLIADGTSKGFTKSPTEQLFEQARKASEAAQQQQQQQERERARTR
jgi:conjugative relaxase-like TrwC/TraI family protein